MSEILWRESRQFSETRSALYWWKNCRQTEIPLRGFVWMIHGLGEHMGRYSELAHFLNQLDFDVLGIDLPGHGLSRKDGKQLLLPSIPQALGEVEDAFEYWISEGPLKQKVLHQPWYLAGHSLGALVALLWLTRGARLPQSNWEFAKRAFVSAPPLKLRMPAPAWKTKAARVLKNIHPHLLLGNEILPEYLSYDVENVMAYTEDPLVHGYSSPLNYTSILDSADFIEKHALNVEIPLAIAVGEDDPIVDPGALEGFYNYLGTHKIFYKFSHTKHEIFKDVHRNKVFEKLAAWFL